MQNAAITVERQNFRNLFRQTPEMVCILDGPDHVFEFVNDAHVKTLGFDATGMSVREAQPESVEVHDILDRVYQTGVTAELKEIPVTVSDRIRHFNLTYSARKNQQGEIDGIMILGAEITEQYTVREILKSQNHALQMVMQGASLENVLGVLATAMENHIGRSLKCSILLMDSSGKHLLHGAAPSLSKEYNDAIHGVAIGPQVGSCGTAAFLKKEVIVKDIATDPLWQNFKKLALSHQLHSCWSQPILASDGKVIGTFALYNVVANKWSAWEKQIINLIAQTVALIIERRVESEKKLVTELALSESRQLYKASKEQLGLAVEVAKVGFYDWDINKDIVKFSEQMKVDWGIKNEVKSLEDALLRIHPDDRAHVQALIEETMKNNKPYHTEYRVLREDGTMAWMDVRGEVHRDHKGNPIRFFGTSVEITEQKKREAKTEEAQKLAEAANKAKGLFLANMSHEIRTPLGAIMGFLELLKSPSITRENLKDYLGIIERNSKQLLRIVDDVLDLSKIEAGKFEIDVHPFLLKELFDDFNALMSFKAKEKGLSYKVIIDGSLPSWVESDPVRLRQILNNVVGNAIKFTDKGFVKTKIKIENQKLKILVEDSGCGIDEAVMQKLFRPFSQADNSTTRKYGGTGLGLNLTSRLCKALGGHFKLEKSEPQKGSTFSVEIPVNIVASPTTEIPVQTKPTDTKDITSQLKHKKILVVDDSPDNQRLIEVLLGSLQLNMESAFSGEEAIRKIQNRNYDLVLMDIQMPGKDGHETTQYLRSNNYTQPIVALTAHAMKEEYDRCLENGFSDFLSKPINSNLLEKVLIKHLN